jgi:hypothetical protein
VRRAQTFIMGGLFLASGVFFGTLAARLSENAPMARVVFHISSPEILSHPKEQSPPKQNTTQLMGRLIDEEGQPISGAKISLLSQNTGSDAEGRFVFSRVEPGLVSLKVEHPAYLTYQSEPMQAVLGADLDETITLQRPRVVSIQVTKQGRPVSSVEIVSPEHEAIFTDAQGLARVELSHQKTTTARVIASGFQPFLLLLGDEETIKLKLQRPASVRGELLDAPKGVQLMLIPMQEGKLSTSPYVTNADPRFSFQGLLPGSYQMWAKYQGKAWMLQDLYIKEGETQMKVPFLSAPLVADETCEEGFVPTLMTERQEGALVVQKTEGELIAGDRIISIDGVALNDENSFLASWAGARGSLVRLVIERPASKRFVFLTLPRNVELPCQDE